MLLRLIRSIPIASHIHVGYCWLVFIHFNWLNPNVHIKSLWYPHLDSRWVFKVPKIWWSGHKTLNQSQNWMVKSCHGLQFFHVFPNKTNPLNTPFLAVKIPCFLMFFDGQSKSTNSWWVHWLHSTPIFDASIPIDSQFAAHFMVKRSNAKSWVGKNPWWRQDCEQHLHEAQGIFRDVQHWRGEARATWRRGDVETWRRGAWNPCGSETMWGFPKMGVGLEGKPKLASCGTWRFFWRGTPPVVIHFHGIFLYKPSSYWNPLYWRVIYWICPGCGSFTT